MIKECENCGQKHDNPLLIIKNGKEHTFDSFECAISFIAPRCFHCNQIILGKETQHEGESYCSVACSREVHYTPIMP